MNDFSVRNDNCHGADTIKVAIKSHGAESLEATSETDIEGVDVTLLLGQIVSSTVSSKRSPMVAAGWIYLPARERS